MNTYLGMSREDLESLFIYDREKGLILSKKTGKVVGTEYPHGIVIKKRWEGKVLSLSAGKMCYFLLHDVQLSDSDMIRFKDKDYFNLRPENLELCKCANPRQVEERLDFIEVDRRIYFNPNNSLFVVRRGVNQAVYRCFSLKEAVSIRNEWESDKTVHRWDFTVAKYRKYFNN